MEKSRLFLLLICLVGILVLAAPGRVAAEESSDSTNGVSIQVDRLEGNSKGQSTSSDVSNLFKVKDTESIDTYIIKEKAREQEQVSSLFIKGVEETTHETFKKKNLFTAPMKTNHTGESALQQEASALGSTSLLENVWFTIVLIATAGATILASYQLYKRDNYER